MRVDAHQHYWIYDAARDTWIDETMPQLQRGFFPEDVAPAMRDAGFDAVVAVQAAQSDDETTFLLDAAQHHPMIRGVVGWTDLRSDRLLETLVRHSGNRLLKGFRHIAQAERDDFLVQPDVIAGIKELGAFGYTYDILVYPRQMAAAEQLVAACPGVRFVLDHCGKPPIASGDLTQWRRDFAALSRHENVACKVSGLITEAHHTRWTTADIVPVLDAAVECFGAERLMFGSDWPVCLLAGEYAQVAELVETWASRLTPSEQAAVFGRTAARVYRLED